MTELEQKLENLTKLNEVFRKDRLALVHSEGQFQEAMKDVLVFLGYGENEQISPFDLIKRGYEKGKAL